MNKILLIISLLCFTFKTHAQWIQTNGPECGGVSCFAMSGSNIFAGTFLGGVFLSTNNGASWTSVSTNIPVPLTYVYDLAVMGTTLYAGTGSGIYKSTNNGTSWTPCNNGLSPIDTRSLAVIGTNLFAGTYGGGMYISTNNGNLWTAINNGITTMNMAGSFVNGTDLYIATTSGAFVTSNNGGLWTPFTTGIPNPNVACFAVMGPNFFVGMNSSGGSIYLSTNNGSTWTPKNIGLPPITFIFDLLVNGSQLYASTNHGVFLSNDTANSWTSISTGLPTDINCNILFRNGTKLFTGCGASGVFTTTNNGTLWSHSNVGLVGSIVNRLREKGTDFFAATAGGLFVSPDYGNTWNLLSNGLPEVPTYDIALAGNNLYAAQSISTTGTGGVYLSVNNGSSWAPVSNGIANGVTKLGVNGTNVFAANYTGIYLSTDSGASWTPINNGIPANSSVKDFISSGNSFFAATNNGIFVTTNNGGLWTPANTGLTVLDVRSFTASGSNLYAGVNNGGVFLSTNNGSSWAPVNNGITYLNIASVTSSGSTIFAGSYGAAPGYWSVNSGTSWGGLGVTGIPINTPLLTLVVSGNYLYAGTFGTGVYKYSTLGLSINENNPANAEFFIYPNPVPEGDHMFTISAASHLKITKVEICDMKGAIVYSQHGPDAYKEINVKNIASGIYIVKATTEGKVLTEKLVVE